MDDTKRTQLPWTEKELSERLRSGQLPYFPARLRLCESLPTTERAGTMLEATWQGHSARFAFDYKTRSAPTYLEAAMIQAQKYAREMGLLPLVILPYLSETSLQRLEEAGVSGIDLNGNGILLAPDLALWRSGQGNRFKESQPIRNIFRGTSSLLCRSFLLCPTFPTLTELQIFTRTRFLEHSGIVSEHLTKGTVSKVVRSLEEENIIVRGQDGVKLASAHRLLDRLRGSYSRSSGKRIEGTTSLSSAAIWERLRASEGRYIATGDGSAGRYGLLSGSQKLALYVENIEQVSSRLDITPSRMFPNITLIEEDSDVVYFDARLDGSSLWASPIQTWLELSVSGPREQEAARTLEVLFLEGKGGTL